MRATLIFVVLLCMLLLVVSVVEPREAALYTPLERDASVASNNRFQHQ